VRRGVRLLTWAWAFGVISEILISKWHMLVHSDVLILVQKCNPNKGQELGKETRNDEIRIMLSASATLNSRVVGPTY